MLVRVMQHYVGQLTVYEPDGSIDIEKAKVINEEFEISKQFWGHLVKSGSIENQKNYQSITTHQLC